MTTTSNNSIAAADNATREKFKPSRRRPQLGLFRHCEGSFLSPRNFLMGDETKYPHDAEGTSWQSCLRRSDANVFQIENDKIRRY